MTDSTPEYQTYFRPGDLVSIGLHLADKTFAEDSAMVISLDHSTMQLELCGNGFPPHLVIPAGTRGVLTRLQGRTVYSCNSILKAPASGRLMSLELVEKTLVRERREYARADVNVRVCYSLPVSQEMGRIMREWEELKKCPDRCLGTEPRHCRNDCTGKELQDNLTRVNLSGNGLRFKIRDCLSYGTLLHLKIAIHDDRKDHIHAVGSIVRTRELLPCMEQNAYYSTSMAFRVIDSHDRKKLLEYLLAEQRRAIF
jgi:hypothetical protein